MLAKYQGPYLAGLFILFSGLAARDASAHSASPNGSDGPGSAPLIDATSVAKSAIHTLQGTVPLKVAQSVDSGAMGRTEVIPSMTLVLKRSPEQQKRLDNYIASLNNPASPHYHKWLSAKDVGRMFGPNDKDISTVKDWLQSQGLGVRAVSPDKMLIRFNGSVASVERAFGTNMHRYTSGGKVHFANASEQKIPAALEPVVAGVASLSNFFPTPQVSGVHSVKRDKNGHWDVVDGPTSEFNFLFNGKVFYDLVPADFNAIYDVTNLWSGATPVRGSGQTVVVLENTNVQNTDVTMFRSTFMPPNPAGLFSQVHPAAFVGDTSCADPGVNFNEGEAALDAEWAGAAAPDANIVLASCADSGAEFGAFLAAQNLLYQNAPPAIMSLSYGECELVSAAVGDAAEAATLWSLAAAEGATVFVSSGDAGSAGCDQGAAAATFGLAINGLGSTPYNISVGGTDFDDLSNPGQYWAPGNGYLGQSAFGYIPEQTWNDSCASSKLYPLLGAVDPVTSCNSGRGARFLNTAGGSGGPSYLWNQPIWQQGIAGMPQSQTRSTPDISLFAANGIYGHALIFCMSDAAHGGTPCNYLNPTDAIYNSAGGTSFAAPAMAGIQALINQQTGKSHGNIAPLLYDLARKQYGSVGSPSTSCTPGASNRNCVFHDVTVGDIDVPCFANTGDCYSKNSQSFGVVSDGGRQSMVTAWKAGQGYDYASGLGSVDVTRLVNAISNQDARGSLIPRTWDLYGLDESGNPENGTGIGAILDGHSSILLIDATTGNSNMLHMNGGTVVETNPWDHMFEPGDQVKAVAIDLFSGALTGQTIMESDNAVDHTSNLAVYSYGWINFRFPYPAGWTLVGSGIVDASGVSMEIWRNNATGQIGYWNIACSGSIRFGRLDNINCNRTVGNIINATAGYTPRLADLNGDGYIDIVWTGPNNDIYYWINDGTGNYTRTYGGTFPAGWVLEGAGEIAGSGKTDLVWFNPTTHQVGWWIMNGTAVVDRQIRSVAPGYTIASIEDFDGDGLADLLWTDSAGDAYIWQGTGGGFVSQRVADAQGNPYLIPAGYVVQNNRLQGVPLVQPIVTAAVTANVAK